MIFKTIFLVLTAFIILMTTIGWSQDLMIYPAKGQSNDQMEKDKFECYTWAKGQTGFDPMAQPTASAPPPAQEAPKGGAVRGAARGALVGVTVGAIAFAIVTTSGLIPACSNPNHAPVRANPVCTSSRMRRAAALLGMDASARSTFHVAKRRSGFPTQQGQPCSQVQSRTAA